MEQDKIEYDKVCQNTTKHSTESFLIILYLSNQNKHCWKSSRRTGMIILQVLMLKIRYLNLQLDSKGVWKLIMIKYKPKYE